MNIPGFTAESSLAPTTGIYHGQAVFTGFPSGDSVGVVPQLLGLNSPLLDYWRCRANGGGDLVCRFFAGLAPFTIGGVLVAR